MRDVVGMGDKMAVEVATPKPPQGDSVDAPHMAADFVMWGKNDAGETVKIWEDKVKNVVVNQGRNLLANNFLASHNVFTRAYLFLHSAGTPGTGTFWNDISGSVVNGYSASMLPATFATTSTLSNQSNLVWTYATNMSFTNAGTITAHGAGLVFHTSASANTANWSSNADWRLYNIGTFSNGSQTIATNNSLSVTLSLNFTS